MSMHQVQQQHECAICSVSACAVHVHLQQCQNTVQRTFELQARSAHYELRGVTGPSPLRLASKQCTRLAEAVHNTCQP